MKVVNYDKKIGITRECSQSNENLLYEEKQSSKYLITKSFQLFEMKQERRDLMHFDIVSDIHLDAWIGTTKDQKRTKQQIALFVEKIIPNNPAKVLVIAGDIGHDNNQNQWLLQILKQFYPTILFVFGNHDLYLMDTDSQIYFDKNSLNRWQEMKKKAEAIDGVTVLDGNTVKIEGVTFGGTGAWYDFSYGTMFLNATLQTIHKNWCNRSNDSRKIFGEPTDVITFSNREKSKLFSLVPEVDIIVTHVPPLIPRLFDITYDGELSNSFFYMSIREYIDQLKNKIWIYGHVHTRNYVRTMGCDFFNAAVGYPTEGRLDRKGIVRIE